MIFDSTGEGSVEHGSGYASEGTADSNRDPDAGQSGGGSAAPDGGSSEKRSSGNSPDPSSAGGPSPTGSEPSVDSDDRFRDALATLEGRGAVVLVLGAGVAAAHAAVSRQLMGSTEFDRRRVVALAGPDRPDVGSHLPPGAPRDEDHLRVVTEGVPTRDGAAAAAQPSVTAGPGSSAPSDDGGLDVGAFGASISTAVDDLEPSGGFDPGELRVAVDGLEPLFGAVPDEDVVQFVHLLGHRIRRATGKAHFHLATDPEDSRAKLVGNVADLVIELSVVDGTPHQQWHVRNGPTSRRVPVPLDDERDE